MKSEYVFDNAWVRASERLGHLESRFDPGTIRHFERLGVAEGWHCLEVGAGGGSIAAWLCERVGPTDLDTRFLERLTSPNLDVRRHDLTSEALPEAAFDLVHSRLVLMHLPERDRVLRSMIGALKPGGWLLVEEAGSAIFPPDPSYAGAALFERGIAAYIQVQTAAGVDHFYGRRLYGEVCGAGLCDVEGEGRVSAMRGGMAAARTAQLSIAQLRDRIVSAGMLTEGEVDRFLAVFDDPNFVTMGITLIAVWGRKPT